MKKTFYLLLILLLHIGCDNMQKKAGSPQAIDIENISKGPVLHTKLSNSQLEKIKKIQTTFFEVYPISLEETIDNFKRDENPDDEIKIWENMSASYISFTKNHSSQNDLNIRLEAFQLILMRSMMTEKELLESFKFKELSKENIETIFNSYSLEAKPFKIKK